MSAAEIADEDLCIACGACCDGSLFINASLKDGDAMIAGMTAHSDRGIDGFALPCPHFDGICTRYDIRPRVCRSFGCELLADLKSGRVTRPQADAALAELRAARADLARHLPDAADNAPLAIRTFAATFTQYTDQQQFMAENTATFAAIRRMQDAMNAFVKTAASRAAAAAMQ